MEAHGGIRHKSLFYAIKNREFSCRPLQSPLRKMAEKFSKIANLKTIISALAAAVIAMLGAICNLIMAVVK